MIVEHSHARLFVNALRACRVVEDLHELAEWRTLLAKIHFEPLIVTGLIKREIRVDKKSTHQVDSLVGRC